VTTPLQAAHDAFIAHEEAHDLWSLTAYGRRYWHFVRYEVFGWLMQAMELQGRRHGGYADKPLREKLAIHPRRWPATLRRSHWRDLRPVDLVVFPHPRHVPSDGSWVCPYTAPLVAGLPHRRYVVKDLYEGRHPHPLVDADLRYIEWARRAAELGFMATDAWRGAWLTKADRATCDAWVTDLERAFGVALDHDKVFRYLRKSIRNDLTLEKVYHRLFDKTRPRAAVCAVHYTHRNLAMTRVAKARGIPVVEVQHGFFGASHLAYNVAPGRHPESFPDYLTVFGDFWRENTPGLPLPPERTPAIGFAWLERERARATPDAPDATRKTVLFVSQGTVAEALSEAAVGLSQRLDPARWRIRFKHHPSDLSGWRERYPALAASSVEVIERPLGIYDAFAAADAQVGVYSTAVYEGLAFGLRTCVLAVPGHEGMLPLVEAGVVAKCADADELAAALESDTKPSPAQLDRIWRPGAVGRFRDFVTELIGPPAR